MVNAFDIDTVETLDPGLRRIVKRRADLLGPAYKLFYRNPVRFVRAEGVHLYDADGQAYLDAYNNVPSVGHCHPRVVEAIARQAATLNTHTRYASDLVLDYAERLLATFPAALGHVMFTCTGSEAVDLALRIARFQAGGDGTLITANAYHGVTTAAAEISPSLGPGVPLGRPVWTVTPPVPDSDPGLAAPVTAHDAGLAFAARVRAAIADMTRHGVTFAAFIADSILSTDGILPDPAGFLRPVIDAVHEAGGLYIADEVQSGFARTGDAMWGFQRHGIVPDLVVMGKPMGNGMPIAGVAVRPEIVAEFGRQVRYFNTFGGNSVCVAAAAAVLDVVEAEGLQENARVVGRYLLDALVAIADGTPRIGGVRGAGLYAGVDFVEPGTAAPDGDAAIRVVNALRERHVLISATGPHGNTLKIRPPLPFATEHVDQLTAALSDALATTFHLPA
ncbi:MAG: aspartate aminotransferase family protein [Actinomycetota bacterium]|nr:aspartate aminotransferase family protein [Actinomycetota bacterium]